MHGSWRADTVHAQRGCKRDDKEKLLAALEELKRSASASDAALGGLRATFGLGAVALVIAVLVLSCRWCC